MKFQFIKHIYSQTLLVILIGFLVLKNVNAAGVSISPPTVELEPGNSYQLTIKNTNTETFSATILPTLFQQVEGTRSVRPLTTEEIKEFNLSENITISPASVNIESGKEVTVEVSYLKSIPDYFVGVIVQQASAGNNDIGIGASLASYIIDYSVDESNVDNLLSGSITIRPANKLLGFAMEGDYIIDINLTNNSSITLKPSGEVAVFGVENNKKLEQFSITADIIDGFTPGNTKTISRKISKLDLSEIKNLKAIVKITAEKETFELSDTTSVGTTSSLPLIIVLMIVLLLIVLYIFFLKKRSKKKITKKTIKPGINNYSMQPDIFNRLR